MLCALGYLDADTLEESTTLLLLLLYDVGFKYDCTAQLIEYYGWLLQRVVDSGDPKHPLTVALDRMTVQLFNTEEVSIRCVKCGEVWGTCTTRCCRSSMCGLLGSVWGRC